MNKDIDYQIAPIMALHKLENRMQITREAKIALSRIASTTAAYISYLATQCTKRKTLSGQDILKACFKTGIPGLRQVANDFNQNMNDVEAQNRVDESNEEATDQ